MINRIKPFRAVLVHEDLEDDGGVPTEIIEYTWTFRGAKRVQKATYAKMDRPYSKWVAIFPSNWMWWWTLNAGTVYTYVGFNEETETFITHKIAWWRRERLWRALWRLVGGKHPGGAHRAAEQEN